MVSFMARFKMVNEMVESRSIVFSKEAAMDEMVVKLWSSRTGPSR